MNCRERVIRAISHRETDIVPYSILFTPDEKQKMAAYYGDPNFEEQIGNHFAYLDIRPPKKEVRPGYVRDEFGVIWNRTRDTQIGVVEEYAVDAGNVDTFPFPDLTVPERYAKFGEFIDKNQDKFVVVRYSHALFERAWSLYGMENLMCDMMLNPRAVGRLFDRITEYFLDLLDCVKTFQGIDCVYYGDDWGQQRGLIMGPKLWRSMIKPRIREVYQKAKSMGKYVYIHTCGDIREILPDLIEIGVDIYDPFQPEAFDIYELKRQYGQDITFFGGVSLQHTLPFGTPQEVMDETIYKARVLSRGGGYLIAPSHAVTGDVPAENMDAMIKVLKNQPKYILKEAFPI